MRIRRLGRTGLKVTEICLGTMTFGQQADEETAAAILDRAGEAGVNFVDTADVYPVPVTPETMGLTEEIVGRWLKGKRDRMVLASKCALRPPGTGPGPNDEGLSRKHNLEAVDTSLRRLQTDYIDLYQVQSPDPSTPLDEMLRALDDLVHSGRARYIGCSNFEGWRLSRAVGISDRLNIARFDSVQPRYNLLAREVEIDLLPVCREEGVGVIAYNPLAGGLLTGKYRRGQQPPAGTRFALGGGTGPLYRGRYWREEMFDRVERVEEIAKRLGVTPAQLSLAWLLQQPLLTSAIVGATSPAQLDDSLKAVDLELDQRTLDELSQIAPPVEP